MARNNQIVLVRRGNEALVRTPESREEYITPAVVIFETPDSFVLKLDLPGARKDAIQLNVEPSVVTVRAGVTPLHRENANVLFKEITSGGYKRVFNLSEGIDHSKVQAEFHDGVLTVSLPKTEPMKAKEIPIN